MSVQEIVVGTKEVPSFIKKKHELDKLLKSVQKVSQDAVDLLKKTMLDEKTDIKLRVQCAESLIDIEKSVAKQINDDEMARTVAEIKLGEGGGSKKLALVEDKPKKPQLNFEDIREV